jgi:hypothetical protein
VGAGAVDPKSKGKQALARRGREIAGLTHHTPLRPAPPCPPSPAHAGRSPPIPFTSVDETGKQHYLDATVAYKRAVLNAIAYLTKWAGVGGGQTSGASLQRRRRAIHCAQHCERAERAGRHSLWRGVL